MYSSLLAVSGLYVGAIAVVSVVISCVGCASCGICALWKPVFYVADLFFLVGVIWQAAVYDSPPPVELGGYDYDALGAGAVVGLGLASSAIVVVKLPVGDRCLRPVRWLLTAVRAGFAALAMYALYPGPGDELTLYAAPGGAVLFLFAGVALILFMPLRDW